MQALQKKKICHVKNTFKPLSYTPAVRGHYSGMEGEVTHPCNPNPCRGDEVCEIRRRKCKHPEKCRQFICKSGEKGMVTAVLHLGVSFIPLCVFGTEKRERERYRKWAGERESWVDLARENTREVKCFCPVMPLVVLF